MNDEQPMGTQTAVGENPESYWDRYTQGYAESPQQCFVKSEFFYRRWGRLS